MENVAIIGSAIVGVLGALLAAFAVHRSADSLKKKGTYIPN